MGKVDLKWVVRVKNRVVEEVGVSRGYVCGFVNALRFVESMLMNEEPIFERNEVLGKAKKDDDLKVEGICRDEYRHTSDR